MKARFFAVPLTLAAFLISASLHTVSAQEERGAELADTVTVYTPQEAQEVLEDETFQGTVIIGVDFDLTAGRYGVDVEGSRERMVTLDLNGHTLCCGWYLTNRASLQIIDSLGTGELLFDYDSGDLSNYGLLTLESGRIVGERSKKRHPDRRGQTLRPLIRNYWMGEFVIRGGEIQSEKSTSLIENDGGRLEVQGGTLTSRYAAICSGNGTELFGISGQDEDGNWFGTTGTRWYDGTLTIRGGYIQGEEGAIRASDTDVTITGGIIRGQIEMARHNEYKDGHSIKLEAPQEMQYYNASGETITLPKPTYELHEENGEMKRGYWDVPTDAWFYAPVQTLMDDRVLDYGGYNDKGNFCPAEPLTRGQAAALLARACGAEVEEEATESPFLDVTDATPYTKYINAGKKLGLLSGDGQGQFYPEITIARQEFAVLVMNAVHQHGLELLPEVPGVAFQDEDAIALWAKDAVAEGASYGLWNGTDSGEFLPLDPITRAEGAAVLARLLDRLP